MRFVVMVMLAVFALIAPAFAQEIAPAAEGAVNPIVGLLTGLLGAGFFAKWGTVTVAGIALLRAAAATLSKHAPDARLGPFAPAVNWLAGNTKHAANVPARADDPAGPGAAATSIVLGVLVLGVLVLVACASTGDRAADERIRTLLVIGCTAQCPIVNAVIVDACDGDIDGKVTPPAEPNTLYNVCVQEVAVILAGCPLACEQIPLPSDTPPAEE